MPAAERGQRARPPGPIIRITLVWLSLLLFLVVFLPLCNLSRPFAIALALVPPLAAGWLLGTRGGLLTGLFISPLATFLCFLAGYPLSDIIPYTVLGFVFLGSVGALTGRVHDLSVQRHQERGSSPVETDQTPQAGIALDERLTQIQKLESLGRLAGGVAHDINNILGGILGMASVLVLELDPTSPLAKDAKDIVKACKRGKELTRSLLEFARTECARKELLSLNRTITEVQKLLEMTVSKGVVFDSDLDPDLAHCEGDAGRIHQALLNLALNAVDAMEGKGALTFCTRNVTLEPSDLNLHPDLQPGRHVLVQVRDTGIGMDADTVKHAFEPFFTTKPKGQGTGLGLSMVYGTIKSHGGAIRIDSEPGAGTCVTIHIPAISAQQAESMRSFHALPALPTAKGAILLVDDEELARTSGKRMLEKLGLQVILAENGQVALDVYRQRPKEIALVILDLMMPVMDGAQTLTQLREINPDVPILVTSGFAPDRTTLGPACLEANGFLQKPFELEDLAEKLYSLLGPVDP